MPLDTGAKLGPYAIEAAIGAGGMGEVYRAKDINLKRFVALKVLPEAFAADPERLARFQREAEVLASLNHPNIAQIYGLERADGQTALVMELVEGPTLADRIARGPIAIDEAVPVARQIAEALEAAHEKGIVHRDLKPANIKLTGDRDVKVLDFGLAKAMEPERSMPNVSQSPTLSLMATQAGLILGTAAYMSPEQARGLAADHRSDVFSFGVVLYEMLTGRQPFPGETVPDMLASVLAREPDLSALPPNLNPRLPDLIRRCLDKNPKRRWQAIGDMRAELETIVAVPFQTATESAAIRRLPWWQWTAAVAVTATIAAAIGGFAVWTWRPAINSPVIRLSAPLPPGQRFALGQRRALAISPDGQHIVYVAGDQIMLRSLSDSQSSPISSIAQSAATVLLANPVFSPDGQSVIYSVRGVIEKISIRGGTPTLICPATNPTGMSWDDRGIIFGDGIDIKRVSPSGGKPEVIYHIGQGNPIDPQLLPDGRLLMAISADPSGQKSRIVVQPLPAGEAKTLVEDGSDPRYVPTGHLVFSRAGVLFAAGFDLNRTTLTSEAVPIVVGVRRGATTFTSGAAQYAVSKSGSLIYIPGPALYSTSQRGLISIDLKGVREQLKVPPLAYNSPRVSQDGRWLAVDVDDGNDTNVYVYRLLGDTQIRRVTLDGHSRNPIWSPDSSRVTFESDLEGQAGIYRQSLDGGPAEQLTKAEPGTAHLPEAWSPDGKTLLFAVQRDAIYRLQSYSTVDKRIAPFGGVESVYPPASTFSPDGKFVAYYQRDRGALTGSLFVQPAAGGTRYEVNKGGGIHPVWLGGAQPRLVYRLPRATTIVEIFTQPEFGVGKPSELPFGVVFNPGPAVSRNVDVVGGSERFVMVSIAQDSSGDPQLDDDTIQVVVNWFEELKRLVAPGSGR